MLLAGLCSAAFAGEYRTFPYRPIQQFSPVAQHHHHHHGHWRHGGNGWEWVIPAVIGGVIVYEATRPPVVQQPVIIQQQPQQPQICSPWTEIQNPDGTITRTRTCNQ